MQQKSTKGMGRRILTGLSISLISVLIILIIFLLIRSPGKLDSFEDIPEGQGQYVISEKIFTEINGAEQGMIIRGKDYRNPVILFLHGGPGMPEYFLADPSFQKIYDSFTLCFWEQRGAGISYRSDADLSKITTETLIDDTAEVARYLCSRFGREKLILLGHSWGSFIGIQAASKYPELFRYYIGVGQISDQRESEMRAFQYIREELISRGGGKDLKKLEEFIDRKTQTVEISGFLNSGFRDYIMHRMSIGTMKNMSSVITGIFLPHMICRAYTLPEKITLWSSKGKLVGESPLRGDMLNTKLPEKISKLNIPVYFISGSNDYTVNYELSREYLEILDAPQKGFYLFENSAHSPIFEEPDRFLELLKEELY